MLWLLSSLADTGYNGSKKWYIFSSHGLYLPGWRSFHFFYSVMYKPYCICALLTIIESFDVKNRSITRKITLIQNLQNFLRLINTHAVDRAVVGHTGHTFYVLVQVLVLTMSFSVHVYSLLSSLEKRNPPTSTRRRRRWKENLLSFCRFLASLNRRSRLAVWKSVQLQNSRLV